MKSVKQQWVEIIYDVEFLILFFIRIFVKFGNFECYFDGFFVFTKKHLAVFNQILTFSCDKDKNYWTPSSAKHVPLIFMPKSFEHTDAIKKEYYYRKDSTPFCRGW